MRRIEVTTYFLEMRTRPPAQIAEPPPNTRVLPRRAMDAATYRALYQSVGTPWLWYERCEISDEALEELISDEQVSIYVLECENQVAGYVEFRECQDQTQILYFGLVPRFIGRGLGRFFLEWAVQHSFRRDIQRLWVHTCSLDHARALDTYLGVGFREYRRESGWVRIPQDAVDRQQAADNP